MSALTIADVSADCADDTSPSVLARIEVCALTIDDVNADSAASVFAAMLVCAEVTDDVNADSAASVFAAMLVCALTIDDVSADCAVDTSVSVLEIIEVLAGVIASEIDCKFTAANDGVEVRMGLQLILH